MDVLYESSVNFSQFIFQPVLIAVLIVFAFSYHAHNVKIEKNQKKFLFGEGDSALSLTLSSVMISFLFGFLAIGLYEAIAPNIDLSDEIFILLIVSLLSKNISDKYVCFAYSGSIVCICLLIMGSIINAMGVLNDFNERIVNIVVLVASMHVIEGILVMIDGARGVKYHFSNKDDKIVGGFKFYRRWIIPLPALFNYVGYTSYTTTMKKREKVFRSALKLISYGTLLGIASRVLDDGLYFNLILIILMFLGHEIINKQMYFEKHEGTEIFISENGISVLDCIKSGKAKKVGLTSSDLITHVNGVKTNDKDYILNLFDEGIRKFNFDVLKYNGKLMRYELKLNSIDELGIVLVPTANPYVGKKSFSQVLGEVI